MISCAFTALSVAGDAGWSTVPDNYSRGSNGTQDDGGFWRETGRRPGTPGDRSAPRTTGEQYIAPFPCSVCLSLRSL